MDVRREIELYALPEDRPVLLWLFERYHWASQWSFVTTCTHQRYGVYSYQTHRIWAPSPEGRILFTHQGLLDRIAVLEAERDERALMDEAENDF